MAMTQPEKAGAPPCGLYLVLPQNCLQVEFLQDLRDLFRAINASSYEKNSHVLEFRPAEELEEDIDPEALKALCAFTQSQGMVFMCAQDIERARACGADGVLIDKIPDITAARSVLGDEAIIGMRCGLSRLKAEHALNAGADYVSFYDPTGNFPNPNIIDWWCCKTDVPCLVEGNFTNENCGFYVTAGAEFIDASAYVWNHPEGVMQGVVNMAYAIDVSFDDSQTENIKQKGLFS